MRHSLLFAALALFAIVLSPTWEATLPLPGLLLRSRRWGSWACRMLLDVAYAVRCHGVEGPVRLASFLVAYVLLAALVVAVWITAPLVTLVLFLAASAHHFGADVELGASQGIRLLRGAPLIVLPALLHAPELEGLFAALVPLAEAASLTRVLVGAAPLLLAALLLDALRLARSRDARASGRLLEHLTIVALGVLAHPLLAFTVGFCVLHSPRHLQRTQRALGLDGAAMLRAAVLPTVATFVGAAMFLAGADPAALDDELLRLVFIGLAALTAPHMLVVEPVLRRRVGRRGCSCTWPAGCAPGSLRDDGA